MRRTSARARLRGPAALLVLAAAAAHPARAATLAAATLTDSFAMAPDGGGVIALFVPPIVLMTFTAANMLTKRHHRAKPGAMHGAGQLHAALLSLISRRRDPSEQTGGTVSNDAAEVAQVTSPFVGMLQQMENRLAVVATLIGAATSALSHAPELDHSADDDPSVAAVMRSESAFVLGAAQSLEASIGDAADAVNELAGEIIGAATSALSASDLSARAEDVAKVAAVTLTRLEGAARQIAEIAALIDKVASQTRQAPAVTFACVAKIIDGAAQAQQFIDEVSGLIAKLHDAMRAVSEDVGMPAAQTENIGTPLANHLAQSISGMQQRTGPTTDCAAAACDQACPPVVPDGRSVGDARPVDGLPPKFG